MSFCPGDMCSSLKLSFWHGGRCLFLKMKSKARPLLSVKERKKGKKSGRVVEDSISVLEWDKDTLGTVIVLTLLDYRNRGRGNH